MEKETKKAIKDTGIVGCLFAGFVVALVIMSNVGNVVNQPTVTQGEWRQIVMPALGDNTPGEYGWLNFSVTQNGVNAFTTNITHNATVYASTDTNGSNANERVPHSTAFEISLKILLNATWIDSDGTFQKDYLKCWVNCTDTTPAIDTVVATIYNITGTTDPNHYWVYAVVDNSGSGYTITDGLHVDSVSYTFEGYYVAGTL